MSIEPEDLDPVSTIKGIIVAVPISAALWWCLVDGSMFAVNFLQDHLSMHIVLRAALLITGECIVLAVAWLTHTPTAVRESDPGAWGRAR